MYKNNPEKYTISPVWIVIVSAAIIGLIAVSAHGQEYLDPLDPEKEATTTVSYASSDLVPEGEFPEMLASIEEGATTTLDQIEGCDTIVFQDGFDSGSAISDTEYTELYNTTYAVSGSQARVAENAGGSGENEGFYTVDTYSGDFCVLWSASSSIDVAGTQQRVGLRIDADDYITFFRYWNSSPGWFNPRIDSSFAGSVTTHYSDTTSGGDTSNVAVPRDWLIVKTGTVFDFYESRDHVTFELLVSADITSWSADQEWSIFQDTLNNYNTGSFYLQELTVYEAEAVATTSTTTTATTTTDVFVSVTYGFAFIFFGAGFLVAYKILKP